MGVALMFPGLLLNHIKDSGIKVPEDLENYNIEDYPHWHVYKVLHLGANLPAGALGENAKIIGKLSIEEVMKVTVQDLENLGCRLRSDNVLD